MAHPNLEERNRWRSLDLAIDHRLRKNSPGGKRSQRPAVDCASPCERQQRIKQLH